MYNYEVSCDKSRLDKEFIYQNLKDCYWCLGIPRKTVFAAIEGSLCFGIYKDEEQVGFARVITDQATFAYLCDVFITTEFRGKGLSKMLLHEVMNYPLLQGLRRFSLATKDAHSLYEQFGFKKIQTLDRWMEIVKPDIYLPG